MDIQLAADAQVLANRWEAASRRGDEVTAGALWESYLEACDLAGCCSALGCIATATDGDGRCSRHSHDNLG